jgi:Ca-activated chloride channel family protein
MNIDYPFFLYGLLALPPLAFLLFIRSKKSYIIMQQLTLENSAFILQRAFLSGLFFILALLCLIIAASMPSIVVPSLEKRAGLSDIVFAFDISRSMNVRDMQTVDGESVSRLETASKMAGDILLALDKTSLDYRYAVALGKGDGVLAIPLTYDTEIIRIMFRALGSSAAISGGTNTERMLNAAKSAFNPALLKSYPAEKIIILFSDGESHEGRFLEAVKSSEALGITVFAVCVGSEKGGPIPLDNDPAAENAGGGTFLKDADGGNIISAAQPDNLREAVLSAKGAFFMPETAETKQTVDAVITRLTQSYIPAALTNDMQPDLESIRAAIPGMTQIASTKKEYIHFVFLLLTVIFFILHKCAPLKCLLFDAMSKKEDGGGTEESRKYPRKSAQLLNKIKSAVFPALVVILFASCAPVEAKFRLVEGNFLSSRGMTEKAVQSYEYALLRSKDAQTAAYALYGLAVARISEAESMKRGTMGTRALSLLRDAHILLGDGGDETFSLEKDETGMRENDAVRGHEHNKRYRDIAFRIHYNAGIVYYNAGNIENAVRHFRLALLADPSRVEAKRNLELSLARLPDERSLGAGSSMTAHRLSENNSRDAERKGNEVLFDFIQQKEEDRWKSWAWQGGETDSALDY